MNHWFLCGRDLMWVLVGGFPLARAFVGGYKVSEGERSGDISWMLCSAILSQVAIILLLWFRVIE